MKINQRIAQFFQLLGLLLLLWSSFLVVRFFLERTESELQFTVPKSASLNVKVDGDKLINSVLFVTIIEKRDPELAKKIRVLLNKNDNSSERKNIFIGVDLFHTIQFFRDKWDNQSIEGFIFKIDNSELWDSQAPQLFGSNSVVLRNKTTGLVLLSGNLNKLSLETYYKKNMTSFLIVDENKEHSNLLVYKQYFPSENGNLITNISANGNLYKNLFILKGSILPTDNLQLESQRYQLSPSHLSVNGRLLPKIWNDLLYDFCAKNLDSIPKIESFSLNYSGLELTTTANQVLPLPSMELVLSFDKSFSIIEFVSNVISNRDVDVQVFDDYIQIGKRIYYVKQLDEKSIYIGINKKPVFQKVNNEMILSIKGNPKELINVKGSRFVTAMIKMSDTYKSFETLFSSSENVSLEVKSSNRKVLIYEGKFEFKEEADATNEFLKFMFSMQSTR